MRRFIQSNLVIVGGLAFLALFAAVGAFAAPDATPWPDPFQDGGSGGAVTLAGETPEATLDDATPGEIETPDGDVEAEGVDDLSVPADSPACAGDPAHPNPHDTDGDGDGCREVETEDGTKNLPDPAADAHEGTPGLIGRGDGDGLGQPECLPLGPPEGRPRDGRPDGDPPFGPPTDVPLGPPDCVALGATPAATPTATPTPVP